MSYARSLKEKLKQSVKLVGMGHLEFMVEVYDRSYEKFIKHNLNILGDLGEFIEEVFIMLRDYYQKFMQRKQEHGFTKAISISYKEFREDQKAFYKRCLWAQRVSEEARKAGVEADRMYRALRF